MKPPLSSRLRNTLQETFRQVRVRMATRHLHGPLRVERGQEDVTVLAVVREFDFFAEAFFEHYDRLGVKHYVFIDNGSLDRTAEAIRRHPRTTLFQNHLPFQFLDSPMRRFLLGRYARRHWALQVDADEFFEFPGSSRRSLAELIQYLRKHRYNAVPAQMLDLFPDGPLRPASRFERAEYRYYDISAVEQDKRPRGAVASPGSDAPWLSGGIRAVHFGIRPLLTKHPLLTEFGTVGYPNMHRIRGARLADFDALILHYKFATDLLAVSEQAVKEKNHWNDSLEYVAYRDVLRKNPSLSLRLPSSRRYESPDQLAGPEFLPAGPTYAAWAGLTQPAAVCAGI